MSLHKAIKVSILEMRQDTDEETRTYKRKTDETGKPIPNTTVIIEEMIDKDKKFNYNPRR